MKTTTTIALAIASVALCAVPRADAVIYGYYIGTDNMATFSTGTYAGLPNPNHNRLTLLYAHSYPVNPPPGEIDASINHFHSVGSLRYTGPAAAPGIAFGNSRIPEGARPAIPLQQGSAAFAGRLVSTPLSDPVIGEYTNLTFSPLSQLRAFHLNGIPNEPEDYMYFGQVHPTNPALSTAASNQRFSTTSLAGSDVHFNLVSITPGLNVANSAGVSLYDAPGDEFHLGDGDSFTLFEPHFWTDATAAPGTYSATFKMTDANGLFGDSGEFRWEFTVVPEPGSAVTATLAGLVLMARRRRS
jgi:hypothetical protein